VIEQSLKDHVALIERPLSASKIFYNRIKQNKKNSTGAMPSVERTPPARRPGTRVRDAGRGFPPDRKSHDDELSAQADH
jgi:hypothetical protein